MKTLPLLPVLALLLLTACDPTAAQPEPEGDPCEPNGHIHRDPQGDWCHCDRGFMVPEGQLACVVDPSYKPPDGPFDFGDNGEHACWHTTNGPFATVQASPTQQPRVDAFHTWYTVKLRPEGGQSVGTFSYRAFATGRFVAYLSTPDVPLAFSEGQLPVPILGQQASTACPGIRHMVGVELTKGVTYTLQLGPTSLPELNMVIEYLQ